MADEKSGDKLLYCSFCGKSQHEVHKLIAGPSVFICDECIDLCNDILKEEGVASTNSKKGVREKVSTPEEICALLDQYVIGQLRAKKILSVAVYEHYKRTGKHSGRSKKNSDVEIAKSNVLLIGPTGSGKTLLAQTLARILDVPFVVADATKFTEAGYVGEDVESIIKKLLEQCDGDVEKAQRGIVYIDEIDKIARKGGATAPPARDVSGEGVQTALLKMLEGTIANVQMKDGPRHPNAESIPVDTTNILFIVGGAFTGLEKIVENRTSVGGMGFNSPPKSSANRKNLSALLSDIQPEDLIMFGLIPEFVGRIPVIAALDELDEAALMSILTEPKNALVKQFQASAEMDGIELEFTPGALRAIAVKAIEKKMGARGLRKVLEDALTDLKFTMPGKGITKVIIDDRVIRLEGEAVIEKGTAPTPPPKNP